jgi:thiol-disulfide isomerase/thioredoxin
MRRNSIFQPVFTAATVLMVALSTGFANGQTTAPAKVTQIDIIALKRLVRPAGKPLLVNFWATWCDPCREEYPDLVKIDQEYRGKIDFITVSLDDIADKDIAVPKFLTGMKAEMPSYLLVTDNEEAAMGVVSKDWTGGLPFTILYDPKGGVLYARQGKVKIEALKAALVRSTTLTPITQAAQR